MNHSGRSWQSRQEDDWPERMTEANMHGLALGEWDALTEAERDELRRQAGETVDETAYRLDCEMFGPDDQDADGPREGDCLECDGHGVIPCSECSMGADECSKCGGTGRKQYASGAAPR